MLSTNVARYCPWFAPVLVILIFLMGENCGVGRTAILGLPDSMTLHGVSLIATPGSVGRMATGYGSRWVWPLSCTSGAVVVIGVSTGLEWGTMGEVWGLGDDASSDCSTNCSRNSGGNVKGVVRSSLCSAGGGEMSS